MIARTSHSYAPRERCRARKSPIPVSVSGMAIATPCPQIAKSQPTRCRGGPITWSVAALLATEPQLLLTTTS
jgi:hypothetical protein